MYRAVAKFISLVLVVGISGCSWFSDSDKEENREPYPLTSFNAEVEVKTLWSTRVGDADESRYQRLVPAIDGGRIFAAAADGMVVALDPVKGRKVWKVNILDFYSDADSGGFLSFGGQKGDVISGGVGVGNNLVLIGSSAGDIIALNQGDGSLAWKSRVSSEVLVPPQISRDSVVVQAIDGKVVAYNALDGRKLWTYSTSVPSLTLRGTSTPILQQNTLIAGFANGKVAMLDMEQGLPHWEQKVAVGQGQSELERLVDIDGTMVIEGSRIFVVSYQGRLVALNGSTGAIEWQHEASSFAGLGSGFGQVYLAADNSVLTAYDMASSKEVWKVDALTYRQITAPAAVGNYIVVGDLEGYIHFIAQSDGRFVGRKKVDGDGIRSTVMTRNDEIYVLGNSGKLTALKVL